MKNSNNQARWGKRGQIVLAIFLAGLVAVVAVISWWFYKNTNSDYVYNPVDSSIETVEYAPQIEQDIDSINNTNQEELFDANQLQQAVSTWDTSINGTASVVVMSTDGDILAELNKDKQYFAASIYKLYVAYAGYQQWDEALINPEEQFINGHNRAECLDLMIRESDSPCAEKLWVEIGKTDLTNQLKGYGFLNTSMNSITTTANDAAIILARIAEAEGITVTSQMSMLDSMKNQIYREALNKGFSSAVTVYNKIGFRELVEYHDVAIVEFTDGRKLIVSVLSENVGTSKIAELGQAIELATIE